jgi:hypothetical protein
MVVVGASVVVVVGASVVVGGGQEVPPGLAAWAWRRRESNSGGA